MMHFLDGGNRSDEVHEGRFSFGDFRLHREIVGIIHLDVDGLPERWIKIVKGETLRGQIIKKR